MGEDVVVDVELLVVQDCPNEQAAARLLRGCLDEVGLADVEFRTRVISDIAEAEQYGFVGSPAFLLNGSDPLSESGAPPAVTCRVYRSAAGVAGVPEASVLRRALKRAAETV